MTLEERERVCVRERDEREGGREDEKARRSFFRPN